MFYRPGFLLALIAFLYNLLNHSNLTVVFARVYKGPLLSVSSLVVYSIIIVST